MTQKKVRRLAQISASCMLDLVQTTISWWHLLKTKLEATCAGI